MSLLRYNATATNAPLPPFPVLFGTSSAMQDFRRNLEAVSRSQLPVLIQGESGTGKELMAQLIHEISPFSRGSLIKVRGSALPPQMVDSELFGYDADPLGGALTASKGMVEQADGGTLFLDEVEDLDLAAQTKLLQFLQDGTFLRVGADHPRHADVRIISATNQDLRKRVEAGLLRSDFYYRINVITLSLPPLRERMEDIPQLVEYFFEQYSREFLRTVPPPSTGLIRMMQGYDWPGNIRQLSNVIRSYILIGSEDVVVEELRSQMPPANDRVSAQIDVSEPISLKNITRKATRDLERQIILKVLQANGWNRQKTAKWLHISYRSLLYKLNGIRKTGKVQQVETSGPDQPQGGAPHFPSRRAA